jgi:hypothetical protein
MRRMNRPLVVFAVLMFAACGGNVVLDTLPQGAGGGGGGGGTPSSGGAPSFGGSPGFGGFQASTTIGTGGFGETSTTTVDVSSCASSSGQPFACQASTCSIGMDGSCDCTGTCDNGDMAEASCPGGGAACNCTLSSFNSSSATSCAPNGASNPCDFQAGCCAQFF